MKSTKAAAFLNEKRKALRAKLDYVARFTDEMWKQQIQHASARSWTMTFEGLDYFYVRDLFPELYGNAMKERKRIQEELNEVEFVLCPPKGRPQRSDPGMTAAIEEWEISKMSLGRLALKHSVSKDKKERQRFAERLKKRLSSRKKSSKSD
jgi:hypothetical protein